MEELVKSLEGSFQVTNEPNSTARAHPRFSQYKQKRSNNDQESRRKKLLEIQKSNRLDYLGLVRKLTDDNWADDTAEDVEEEESMDVQQVVLKKPGRYYKDQLMLSEWLVEVPDDFRTEWLTVLCPIARRCLVIASRGKTYAYTKSGYCVNVFPSGLPGGHYKTTNSNGTILDCLYDEAASTYYVLDLMCWNGHPVYDSETEFRFYWLHEKFKESTSLDGHSKQNPFKFLPLPSFACEESALTGALEGAKFEIDGVLFYHKRSHYTFGSTPLVVWLKPYMVPEILGIDVPACQMQNIPGSYTNYAEHLKFVETMKGRKLIKKDGRGRWRKGRTNNVEMQDSEYGEEDGVVEAMDGNEANAAKEEGGGEGVEEEVVK